MADISGYDSKKPSPFDGGELNFFARGLLQLQRIERFVELVNFLFDFGLGVDCHVVIERYPIQVHSN